MGPETITMLAFCLLLVICVTLGIPTIVALLGGLVLFFAFGLVRRCSPRRLLTQALASVRSTATILVTFALIGMLTALWRASGTIAFIVSEASLLVHASVVLPLTFLLCSGMSLLVGSSFASAATMGSVCMSLGLSMGVSPVPLGGAVLAGVFVGDRCSLVSTSALLVSQLTRTSLAGNVRRMLASGAVPFVVSCLAYVVLGLIIPHGASDGAGTLDVAALFGAEFNLGLACVVPAALVVVLAVAHVDVRLVMAMGIVSAAVLCVGVQGVAPVEVLRCALVGFVATDAQVASLLNGGGVVSMLNVMAIVCVSSAYAGIFSETHLLDGLRGLVARIASRAGAYAATALVSVATSAIACNQTLSIMLAHQLSDGLRGEDGEGPVAGRASTADEEIMAEGAILAEGERMADGRASHECTPTAQCAREAHALDLEDSAVVIAALIPWSIAGAVPLATVGAPTVSMLAACFLYLLPLWRLVRELPGRPHVAPRRQM